MVDSKERMIVDIIELLVSMGTDTYNTMKCMTLAAKEGASNKKFYEHLFDYTDQRRKKEIQEKEK